MTEIERSKKIIDLIWRARSGLDGVNECRFGDKVDAMHKDGLNRVDRLLLEAGGLAAMPTAAPDGQYAGETS